MPIYAVVPTADNNAAKLNSAVEKAVPDSEDRYPLSNGVWLVQYKATAINLAELLGLKAGTELGFALVTEISETNIYGRANSSLWHWMGLQ